MTLEQISESISSNSAINETVMTNDIAQAPSFVGKLIKQTFSKSVLPYITSVMPLSTPSGFVYNMLAYYQGSDTNANYENTKVLKLNVDYVGTLNTNITTNTGAVFTVEYVEGETVLIKIISGTVATTNTFPGYTINNVYTSKLAVKKLFKNYSKVSTETEEPKSIGIKSIRTLMNTDSRKIKSTLTQEAIQDIKSQYGEIAEDMIINIMSSEIALEMDKEVIDYMRSISTLKSDLTLTNNNTADLSYAFKAIVTKVNQELVSLSKKHGKNITGFIVCSNSVVSALISAGVMTFGESGNLDLQLLEEDNNVVGTMQQYVTVIQDKFAEEDYVLVGWKQKGQDVNGKDGNAGVIFSPYNMIVSDFYDPESGKVNVMTINRYGFERNAFDEGGSTGSDYFSTFNVDFSGLVGYEV